MHLCSYRLTEGNHLDVLDKHPSPGRTSVVATHSSCAQAVLDVSCLNSFLSPLALLACSDRGVEVLDVAVMQVGPAAF